MSYQTIKTYFKRRLASFQLVEAKGKFNFDNESENYNNTFIIENPKIELAEGDTLATRFFPNRNFVIRIAYKFSESNLSFEYDSAHTKLENILRDLHSVSNYRTDSIRSVIFNSMTVSVNSSYILAELSFDVQESLQYV